MSNSITDVIHSAVKSEDDEETFQMDIPMDNAINFSPSKHTFLWGSLKAAAVVTISMVVSSLVTARVVSNMNAKQAQKDLNSRTRTRRPHGLTLAADMDVYPGYDGDLLPRGRVTVRFEEDDHEFLVRYQLDGVEPSCESCGVHIHEGESCEEHNLVLGHLYNTSIYGDDDASDPWAVSDAASVFRSTDEGAASDAFVMSNGIGHEATMGRALVIHASDGTRIGCGLLHNPWTMNVMKAEIGPYPDGGSDPQIGLGDVLLAPTGTVQAVALDDGVLMFHVVLEGLEPNCVKCGVHIHEGVNSCDDADVIGDHWFETLETVDRIDPWATEKSTYSTDDFGKADHRFYVYNGYDYEDNLDHVIVVHGQDGTRIGCGVLKLTEFFM